MESLEKRKELVIRPAVKGGGVVILTKNFYHNQLNEMLMDVDTYKKLNNDPTSQYVNELQALVDSGFTTGILSTKEKKYLVPSSSRIPRIYTLPKFHKDLHRSLLSIQLSTGLDNITNGSISGSLPSKECYMNQSLPT